MLTLLRLQMTILLQPSNNLIDLLSLGSHLVKLLLKNIQQKQNNLNLILYLLHLFRLNLKIYLLQKSRHLTPQLLHLLPTLKLQLRLQLLYLQINLRHLSRNHLRHTLQVTQSRQFVIKKTTFYYVTLVFLSVSLSHVLLVLQSLSDVNRFLSVLRKRVRLWTLCHLDTFRIRSRPTYASGTIFHRYYNISMKTVQQLQ